MPKYSYNAWDKTQRAIENIENNVGRREVIPDYRGRPGSERFNPHALFSARERQGIFRAVEADEGVGR